MCPLHWKEKYVTTILCPEEIPARGGWKKMTRVPVTVSTCWPFCLSFLPPFLLFFLFLPILLPLPLTWESFSAFATCDSNALSVFCCPAEMLLWNTGYLGGISSVSSISPEPLPLAGAFCDMSPTSATDPREDQPSAPSGLPSPQADSRREMPAGEDIRLRAVQERLGRSFWDLLWCAASVTWLLVPGPMCLSRAPCPPLLGRRLWVMLLWSRQEL